MFASIKILGIYLIRLTIIQNNLNPIIKCIQVSYKKYYNLVLSHLTG